MITSIDTGTNRIEDWRYDCAKLSGKGDGRQQVALTKRNGCRRPVWDIRERHE